MKRNRSKPNRIHDLRHQLAKRSPLGWRCAYCGGEIECPRCNRNTERAATIDHLTPRALGGHLTLTNTVLACIGCNGAKSDSGVFASSEGAGA